MKFVRPTRELRCFPWHSHSGLRRWWQALGVALLFSVSLDVFSTEPLWAQNSNLFIVNSTDDRIDVAPGDGICDADAGGATTCTVRAAIMEANVLGGRQTIILPPERYDLTLTGANEDQSLRGDLDILQDLTVRAADPTQRAIIDANSLDRVFDIHNGASSVTLQNLTIREGDGLQSRFDQDGGGIRVNTTVELRISGCFITANQARSNGALGISKGSLTLLDSRIISNRATEGFGGINSAVNATIRNSVISGNEGGKVGGIRLLAFSDGRAEVKIENSTISGNQGHVAGLQMDSSNTGLLFVKLTNVTISGNRATQRVASKETPLVGGVAVLGSANLSMDNVTIAQNSGDVGGIFSEDNLGMSNTIIANNSGGDCRTVRSINGFTNLTGDTTCRFFVSTGNQRNVNPLLGPLALNGSQNGTRTHALLAGSPAIESGSNDDFCPVRDQRGIRRPQGARCDKGAFERELSVFLGTALVTPTQVSTSAGQTITLSLSWRVPPTMTWRELNTVDFLLEGAEEQPLVVRFSEGVTETEETDAQGEVVITQAVTPTNLLTLFAATGEIAVGEIGQERLLESELATLDLAQSQLVTNGPDGQSLTLILALRFNQPLAGKTFAITMLASNDNGELQDPAMVGTLAVGPFALYLPTIAR